jgi:hypothetical protein
MMRIWTLVKYEAWVSETFRSTEKYSNAGMTEDAMKVVIMAWKETRKRFVFFCPVSLSDDPHEGVYHTFQFGQLRGSAGSMLG